MIWILAVVCFMFKLNGGSTYQMGSCSPEQQLTVFNTSKYQCLLRPTLIDLRQVISNLTDVIDVMPSMVEVMNCGGNCGHESTSKKCLPVSTKMKSVRVMYIMRETLHDINVQLCGNITVEDHEACECTCPLTAESCYLDLHGNINPHKHFKPDQCLCRCRNLRDRLLCDREWDESNCKCLCPSSSWHECSTGYVFDYEISCKCVPTNMTASLGLVAAFLTIIVCIIGTILGLKRMKQRQIGLFKHLRHDYIVGEDQRLSLGKQTPTETTQLRTFS